MWYGRPPRREGTVRRLHLREIAARRALHRGRGAGIQQRPRRSPRRGARRHRPRVERRPARQRALRSTCPAVAGLGSKARLGDSSAGGRARSGVRPRPARIVLSSTTPRGSRDSGATPSRRTARRRSRRRCRSPAPHISGTLSGAPAASSAPADTARRQSRTRRHPDAPTGRGCAKNLVPAASPPSWLSSTPNPVICSLRSQEEQP